MPLETFQAAHGKLLTHDKLSLCLFTLNSCHIYIAPAAEAAMRFVFISAQIKNVVNGSLFKCDPLLLLPPFLFLSVSSYPISQLS